MSELHDRGPGWAHTRVVAGIGELDGWVERLDRAAVSTADSSLRRCGEVLPPTLHVLAGAGDPPYVASVVCRPLEPGMDAAVAVASMGVLPAVLDADRVVLCWEHVQLSVALGVPGAQALPSGVVVLDADRVGHEVRFHPVRLTPGPDDAPPVVVPQWGSALRRADAQLPEPVSRMLRVWRAEQPCSAAEKFRVISSLDAAGYTTFWVGREHPVQMPPR